MNTLSVRAILYWAVLLSFDRSGVADEIQAAPGNRSPEVSIVWPKPGEVFSVGILIKIKATAIDLDGSIAEVRFFAETNLIGVVTNPPFNVVWCVGSGMRIESEGQWTLKAVAIDNSGATTDSAPVRINYVTGAPPFPILDIVSPSDGAIFPVPATFDFSAEVLASVGDTGPVEFFIGTNSVGLVDPRTSLSATTPPSSVIVSNLAEGEYKLTVRYRGANGNYCRCVLNTNTIRVVKLGVQLPNLAPDGRLQFEVVTSFPGQDTLIQRSTNLVDWATVSTIRPSTNAFAFIEPAGAGSAQRFYHAIVPP